MNYVKRPIIYQRVAKERVIERVIEKAPPQIPQSIDADTIARALVIAMQNMQMPTSGLPSSNKMIDFDNSKTLEQLAKTMTVQRGNNESNFDNLGNEHHTKADKNEVAKTIDLLSNLKD